MNKIITKLDYSEKYLSGPPLTIRILFKMVYSFSSRTFPTVSLLRVLVGFNYGYLSDSLVFLPMSVSTNSCHKSLVTEVIECLNTPQRSMSGQLDTIPVQEDLDLKGSWLARYSQLCRFPEIPTMKNNCIWGDSRTVYPLFLSQQILTCIELQKSGKCDR